MAWLNNDFAPKGYGYTIPLSKTKANLVLAYPEYEENQKFDINNLWNNFFSTAEKDLNEYLQIID